VEWPEKAAGSLPPPDLDITLEFQEAGRVARVAARSGPGASMLATLHSHYPGGA
jgi:tRNA A37 threonylcarbamoyladenosine biosynthesis protein TsaE